MAKTKAVLEKELKTAARESKSLQRELHKALTRVQQLEDVPPVEGRKASRGPDKLIKDNAQQARRLKRLTADNLVIATKNNELVLALAKGKSLCGLLPTKIETSAWGHKVIEYLGEEYVEEMKAFAEG